MVRAFHWQYGDILLAIYFFVFTYYFVLSLKDKYTILLLYYYKPHPVYLAGACAVPSAFTGVDSEAASTDVVAGACCVPSIPWLTEQHRQSSSPLIRTRSTIEHNSVIS